MRTHDGDGGIRVLDADGMSRSVLEASGGSVESIAVRAQSTRPGHIRPTSTSGVSFRCCTCSNCQIIIVSSTVPMPPGVTTKASDVMTN